MQTTFADIVVIVACIASGVLLVYVLQFIWRPSSRSGHNDVIGPNVDTYAVLIAVHAL